MSYNFNFFNNLFRVNLTFLSQRTRIISKDQLLKVLYFFYILQLFLECRIYIFFTVHQWKTHHKSVHNQAENVQSFLMQLFIVLYSALHSNNTKPLWRVLATYFLVFFYKWTQVKIFLEHLWNLWNWMSHFCKKSIFVLSVFWLYVSCTKIEARIMIFIAF